MRSFPFFFDRFSGLNRCCCRRTEESDCCCASSGVLEHLFRLQKWWKFEEVDGGGLRWRVLLVAGGVGTVFICCRCCVVSFVVPVVAPVRLCRR